MRSSKIESMMLKTTTHNWAMRDNDAVQSLNYITPVKPTMKQRNLTNSVKIHTVT